MANLLGANIGANYKGFLNLGTTINTPLDNTLRGITDGMGNTSLLQLATNKAAFIKSESGANPASILRLENTGAFYTSKLTLTDGTTNDANISYIGSNQSLGFGIGVSLNQMILNSLGNVGIGTPTPNFRLNLYGTSALYNIGTNAALSANNNYFIGHGLNDSTPANITSKIGFISDASVGSFSDAIAFYTSPTAFLISPSDSSSERMRITNSGNVGINTSNPSAKLEVRDTTQSFQIRVDGGGASQEGIRSAGGGNLATYNPSTYDWQFGPLTMNPAFFLMSFNGQEVLYGNVTPTNIPVKNNIGVGNSSIYDDGNRVSIGLPVIIGGPTPNASAALDITSTTQGVLFPRMTTAEKNAISPVTPGLVVYDTTLNKLCVRTASAWQTITSA